MCDTLKRPAETPADMMDNIKKHKMIEMPLPMPATSLVPPAQTDAGPPPPLPLPPKTIPDEPTKVDTGSTQLFSRESSDTAQDDIASLGAELFDWLIAPITAEDIVEGTCMDTGKYKHPNEVPELLDGRAVIAASPTLGRGRRAAYSKSSPLWASALALLVSPALQGKEVVFGKEAASLKRARAQAQDRRRGQTQMLPGGFEGKCQRCKQGHYTIKHCRVISGHSDPDWFQTDSTAQTSTRQQPRTTAPSRSSAWIFPQSPLLGGTQLADGVLAISRDRVDPRTIENDVLRLDGGTEYQCDKCHQRFDNRFSFSSHFRTRCNPEEVEGVKASSNRAIKRPERYQEDAKGSLAARTTRGGDVKKKGAERKRETPGDSGAVYTCAACQKEFTNRFAYSAHRKRCRQDVETSEPKKPRQTAERETTQPSREWSLTGLQPASEQAEYHCDKCGQSFQNRYSFSSHFHKRCVSATAPLPSPKTTLPGVELALPAEG